MTHTAIRVALVVALFAVTAATRRAGSRSSGKPIAFERVRVSEGHQQQWREDQKPPCGSGPITITGPVGRTSAAVFSPDGALWIRAGSVYLVRVDDDDLQYLQRYSLPRP